MSAEAAFRVPPFRFLDSACRDWLRPQLSFHRFETGTRIVTQGDEFDRRVFLLLDGMVDVLDRGRPQSAIEAGHYFGERAVMFDMPRAFDVVARTDVRCASLPGEALLGLFERSPVFAQQLGWMLRDKQGLLVPFERFLAELAHGAARGHLVLPRLLSLYRPLRPALHAHAEDDVLDVEALAYAVNRLPRNLTRTLFWFLTDDLPHLYSRPDDVFAPVPTAARRRSVWEMMPGKNLVLLRDGLSDLADLVTCLCIFSVEARKIRHRLRDPALLLELARGGDPELPFAAGELSVLRRLWPELNQRLLEVASHHEDHAISIFKTLDNYGTVHAEAWTAQLAAAVEELFGVEPHGLGDLPVHIVSSNTHSVGNCLSPWLEANGDRIADWGRAAHPELYERPWHDPRDRVVALARAYLERHPEEADRRRLEDDGEGVLHLVETAFTGIEVQLFDLSQRGGHGLLVNVDYAFGQQADVIVSSLIALFGHAIRSINVLGKAGGLRGRRGDLIVATSFVEQDADALLSPATRLDLDRLRARVPDREVHVGPVLTVVGTILQNRPMLGYYRRIWGCVGLEMEGTWYCRPILEAQQRGALRPDLDLRFVYYVSDLPLQAGATLSGPLAPHEGIPPLYAITREILDAIR